MCVSRKKRGKLVKWWFLEIKSYDYDTTNDAVKGERSFYAFDYDCLITLRPVIFTSKLRARRKITIVTKPEKLGVIVNERIWEAANVPLR